MRLPLNLIRTDGGTFSRACLSDETIAEYTDALQQGCVFPPVVVFLEGATGSYWLADGFHRVEAANAIGYREIEIDLKLGTLREAILYAVGANSAHGLRRSPADKHKAVSMLLNDAEWGEYSDRAIARLTQTSHTFVAKIRREITGIKSTERLYQNKYGDLAYMETANIGKSQSLEEKPKTLRLKPDVWKRLEQYQQQWGQNNLEEALAKLLDFPLPLPKPIAPSVVTPRRQRTLGIDPALATLRWAVLEAGTNDYDLPRLLDYGTISTTPKCPTSQRLTELEQDLVEILREFTPTDAAIEIPFLNTDSEQNPKNIQNGLEAIGVVELVCYRERGVIPVRLYSTQWKSHISHGRADNEEITDEIAALFNLSVKPNERLDAIAIAYAGMCGIGGN